MNWGGKSVGGGGQGKNWKGRNGDGFDQNTLYAYIKFSIKKEQKKKKQFDSLNNRRNIKLL